MGHATTSLERGFAGRCTLLLLPILLAGCGDWPHFDYQTSPLLVDTELESDGTEQVQNLSLLTGNALLTGQIENSLYVPDAENPYGLPGWYGGDMDWFQFRVLNPTAVSFTLTWTPQDADLDFYFFKASPDSGDIDTLLAYSAGSGPSPEILQATGLLPDTIYVFAVAGSEGDAVDYEVMVELNETAR